jgi:preprotein translocase subunit SecE
VIEIDKELTMAEKTEKVKEPNAIQRFYRETVGELRKVNWPTPKEAWHLTRIVLVVLALMSILLGVIDFVFAKVVGLIVL